MSGELLSLAAYIKIFVAMMVIVNPLGIIPVFVAMTPHQSRAERMKTARLAAITVAIVLLVSAILGERVLDVFGISIASFKVGGAILVMTTALAMMQAMPSPDKQTPEEAEEAVIKPVSRWCRWRFRCSPGPVRCRPSSFTRARKKPCCIFWRFAARRWASHW